MEKYYVVSATINGDTYYLTQEGRLSPFVAHASFIKTKKQAQFCLNEFMKLWTDTTPLKLKQVELFVKDC